MGCTAIRKLSRHGTARVLDGRCVGVGVWTNRTAGVCIVTLIGAESTFPVTRVGENGNRVSVVSCLPPYIFVPVMWGLFILPQGSAYVFCRLRLGWRRHHLHGPSHSLRFHHLGHQHIWRHLPHHWPPLTRDPCPTPRIRVCLCFLLPISFSFTKTMISLTGRRTAKYFGSGVIIATAFIHLLASGVSELSSPCLAPAWQEYVRALPVCPF